MLLGMKQELSKNYWCNNGIKNIAEPGTYVDKEGQSSPKICPVGTYSSEKGSIKCLVPPEGKYQDAEGQMYYLDCPEFYYCTNGIKKDCPEGYYCTNGTKKICPKGSYCTGGALKQAEPGTYQDQEGQSSLKLCPIGTYCDIAGLTNYKIPPEGHYTDVVGQGYYNICPIGSYCTKGIRTEVPEGAYQDLEGQTTYKLCPSGYYTPTKGQPWCYTVPNGYYTDKAGSKSYLPCPVNTKCLQKNGIPIETNAGDKSQCKPGYYFENGKCLICKGANTSCVNGEKKECPVKDSNAPIYPSGRLDFENEYWGGGACITDNWKTTNWRSCMFGFNQQKRDVIPYYTDIASNPNTKPNDTQNCKWSLW